MSRETEKTEAISENGSPSFVAESKPKQRSPRLKWVSLVLLALIVLMALSFWRHKKATVAISTTNPVVAATRVTKENLYNEMAIPAEFRPYAEVELHAKVSGYLEKMKVDFGDKVKAGQLLATIEVPELHDQLSSAMAMQEKAEVDYTNANLMFTRLQSVNQQHPNLVAQQDLDTAQSKNFSGLAAIAAAQAEVERYQTLFGYTQITAPFDGVVTHRYADPGALIQAGTSGSSSLPLLRISDNYHLRLDFPVSVKYVKDIHLGQAVDVKVDSLGGKKFTGKVTRFTDKVNEETRTMTTEMEVENPSLEIVPGMYAEVILRVEQRQNALSIPTEAVSGEKDATVYVINASDEIESRPVTLGLETPDAYQVTSGLKEGELVMIGNRTSVHPGQKVEAKLVNQPTMGGTFSPSNSPSSTK